MNSAERDHYSVDVVLGGLTTEEREGSANIFSPAMDIYENQTGVFIELELPGIEGSDIKVVWENGKILIKGKKRFDKTSGQDIKFYMLERPYGSFGKVIEIPSPAEADNISAGLINGVLKIFIPYQAE